VNLPVDQVLQQGIEAHKAGQFQAADRIYRFILQEDPADPDANFYLGLLAVDVGYPESSLPHFKLALERRPTEEPYWLALIDALNKCGRIDIAEELLQRGRDIGFRHEDIAQLAKRLDPAPARKHIPGPANAAPQEQVNAVIGLFNQGRIDEVLERMRALLERYPEDVMLHNIQGGANASLGRFDAAIECFDRAIAVNPGFSEAHYNRANALKEKGDLAAAIAGFRNAIRLRPVFAEAHNNLGITLQEAGDLIAAVESFQQAIKIAPDFAEAHNNLGNAAQEAGDVSTAIGHFTRALELAPGFVEAHNNLGNALREIKDFPAAIESFGRALEIAPGFVEAHNNLGIALHERGDLAGAIESYRRALKLKPDFAEALSNLGDALKSSGDLGGAIESFRKALSIKPDFAEAFANMGGAQLDSGDLHGAIESLKRAVDLNPDFPEARYLLGRCYQASSQYAESLEQFRRTDHKDARSFELDCLYLLDRRDEFQDMNRDLYRREIVNPLLGCLACHAETRYRLTLPNSFCSDPIAYIHNQPLEDKAGLVSSLAEQLPVFLSGMRGQPLLEQGQQTAGNIFLADHPLLREAEALIRSKIEEYRAHFAESAEPFLVHWPKAYAIHGWLVRMKSGGFLRSHIHEAGWISGTLYLKVPPGLQGDAGCISFSTHGGVYEDDGLVFPERLVRIKQGDLNLFPSSLFHHTVPFESEEERISLAFDVIPK
jgi:tetratricopeptide (TPR) repeat protein